MALTVANKITILIKKSFFFCASEFLHFYARKNISETNKCPRNETFLGRNVQY